MVPRVVAFIVGVGLWVGLSEPPPLPTRTHEGPMLPSSQVLRLASRGFETLVADYYWLQTIQQVGRAQTAEEYGDTFAYANLCTDLDPRFWLVYYFGGVAIPFNRGREHWVNTTESTTLLRKGLRQFPDDYRLQFVLAHNLMYFDRDYQEAGRILKRLSTYPGAPPYVAQLATRVLAQAGDFELAMDFAIAMRDGAADAGTRAFYEHRILQLQSERELQAVDSAVSRFEAREGRLPHGLDELVATHDLVSAPRDPLGGQVYVDAKGRARTTAEWYRLELYDEAKKVETTKVQGGKLEFQPLRTP